MHHQMEKVRILHQTRMGEHSSHKSPADALLSSQTFTNCCYKVKERHTRVLLPSNTKLAFFFLEIVQFLNLTIFHVFCVVW